MTPKHRPLHKIAALGIVPVVALVLWGLGALLSHLQITHKEAQASIPPESAVPSAPAPSGELDVKPSPADRPTPYRTAEARVRAGSSAGRTLQGLGLSAQD